MPYEGPYSEWSEEQKEKHRQSVRTFRAKNPDKVREGYDKRNARRRELYRTNEEIREESKARSRAAMPDVQKTRRLKLKEEVFSHYGKQCACCGETEESFLTIDHVNNDGAEHRRLRGRGTGAAIYLDIIRRGFPPDFEIACYNCNCGRAKTKGVCAHKRRGVSDVAMLQST